MDWVVCVPLQCNRNTVVIPRDAMYIVQLLISPDLMPGFFVAQNCSPNLGENLNISLFNRDRKVRFFSFYRSRKSRILLYYPTALQAIRNICRPQNVGEQTKSFMNQVMQMQSIAML